MCIRDRALPACLAVPIWQIGKAIGQPPLLPYSSYTLENWARFDPDGPIDLTNIHILQAFEGGMDEAWFILVHVAIEARAGQMLAAIPELLRAASEQDEAGAEAGLAACASVWDDVNAIFDRMPERCDPYIYFHRVRPWIHGWKDNPALPGGLVYDGVAETGGRPQAFRGQTGSQSSIVPAMDALLGVGHAADPLKTFLDELHAYRPPAHRRFIDAVRGTSQLRDFVAKAGSKPLTEAYNQNLVSLARFRTRHLEYAASYINRQARGASGNDPEIGTGGTPFMRYLKKHRDEAEAHLLPV
jgi:indoleamine 2,3-dioxygenase